MNSVEAGPRQCGDCGDFRTEGVDGTPFGEKDSPSGKPLRKGVCNKPFGLILGVRTEDAVCLPPLQRSPRAVK